MDLAEAAFDQKPQSGDSRGAAIMRRRFRFGEQHHELLARNQFLLYQHLHDHRHGSPCADERLARLIDTRRGHFSVPFAGRPPGQWRSQG